MSLSEYFTDEQIESLEPEKSHWLAAQWKPGYQELLEIFPNAKSIIKQIIKADKEKISELREAHRNFWNRQLWRSYKERWFWEIYDEVFFKQEIERLIKRIKKYGFLLEPGSVRAGGDQKEAAKKIPVELFYGGELKRSGKRLMGRCELHENDDTPSFHIYTETNSWYCFGACGAGGDGIDYVMAKYGIGFREAVKRILKHGTSNK